MRVLIADDERNIREILVKLLELEEIECRAVENGLAAQRLLQEEEFDAVVSDLKMPGMSGQELLEWMTEASLETPVILISAFGQAGDAVQALKQGAYDYIVKPFDPDELVHRIRNAVKARRLQSRLEEREGESAYIAESPAMARVKRMMDRIAPTPSTVLITGESGSGKEVAARYLHDRSPVSKGPFLSINVGGIPESLLESELFGHEKGSFTGADRRKTGLFEAAGGGTLFLDEIGDMPMNMQVKLLRVLQERRIRRVGGIDEIPISVRIISATNQPLEERVKEGKFREDLFYRLNVARIELPPLRERREDIIPLSSLLLTRLNRKMGSSIGGMTPEAVELLESYDFPGNIRELENLLERACIYSDGPRIEAVALGLPGSGKRALHEESGTIRHMEKQLILEALQRWEGNRTRAARELGITRRTIQNKIQEYELEKKG